MSAEYFDKVSNDAGLQIVKVDNTLRRATKFVSKAKRTFNMAKTLDESSETYYNDERRNAKRHSRSFTLR